MIFLKFLAIFCLISFGSAEFSDYLKNVECRFKACVTVCGGTDQERVSVKPSENDTESKYYHTIQNQCSEYQKLDDSDEWQISFVSYIEFDFLRH
jgi:hypothetical protein